MEIQLARQPVFDAHERLFGYDVRLRRPTLDARGTLCPEELFVDAFLGVGLDRVSGDSHALVSIDRDMLISRAVELLPRQRIIAQLVGPAVEDASIIEAVEELAWSGYRIALAPSDPRRVPEAILDIAHMVKVDVSRLAARERADVSAWLRSHHVRLLAVNVRHRSERDLCARMGFELFEGYRFSTPETLVQRDIPVERLTTFQLLKLVRDPSSADGEIEAVIQRDVGLSYKLLRMVNSAAFGMREIWSIGHALRLLGREQVARWLALLLVTDAAPGGVRDELTQAAVTRGRMCELIAQASGIPRAGSSLFLVGLLSHLDQILETPMAHLVDRMELASDVRAALLHREDFFGAVLSLVEACETGSWPEVDSYCALVGVQPEQAGAMYLDAIEWASAQREGMGLAPAQPSPIRISGPVTSAV